MARRGCVNGCWLEGIAPSEFVLPCSYRAGEQLPFDKGLFLICRGPIGCLWGSEPERSCLEILGAGDIWGGRSLVVGCEARALGEVQGHWIEQSRWLELLRDPVIEERFVRYLQQREQRRYDWQLVLARGSVRARVAWQMLDLAQRFGERAENTQEIFVPVRLTQAQQAQLCGATRARVWDALREFERKRWMICGPEGFWVRDEGMLKQQSREGL